MATAIISAATALLTARSRDDRSNELHHQQGRHPRTKKSVADPLIDRIEILLADGVMRKRATLLQELSAADPFPLEALSIQKIARSLSRAVEAGRLEIRGRFYTLPGAGGRQEHVPPTELLKAG